MKVLLHACCAPCSIYCIDTLKKENVNIDLFWYNLNIHPYSEYIKRKETLEKYSKMIDINVIYKDYYGLRAFTKNVIDDLDNRCEYCYRIRLMETAKYAKENGYDAFSTTLLVSPYQKHDIIKTIAEDIALKLGITFLYRDFRVGFREGQAKARELELYRQKYCGCIFSEEYIYV